MRIPRSKRRLLGGSGLLAVVFLVAFTVFHDCQPRYGGKRLSSWLDELAPLQSDCLKRGDPESEQTRAVRAIGTNAIPWLLREMRAEPNRIKRSINWLLDMQLVIRLRLPENCGQRWGRAVVGFQLLRGLAEPAVPDLLNLVESRPGYAPDALAYIGPSAVPALQQCLTNTRAYASGKIIVPGNTIAAIHNAANLGHLTKSDLAVLTPTIQAWAHSTNEHASKCAARLLKEYELR